MDMNKRMMYLFVFSGVLALTGFSMVSASTMTGSSGTWSGNYNQLDIQPSQKAEVMFGRSNGCQYGIWSHTAMTKQGSDYATQDTSGVKYPAKSTGAFNRESGWDGYVIEASTYIAEQDQVYTHTYQSHFHRYDAASLDYVMPLGKSLGSTTRDALVTYGSGLSGPYQITTDYSGNSSWYCSKLVSRIFNDITGDPLGGASGAIVSPADIWYDNDVYEYRYGTSSAYDGKGAYSFTGQRQTALTSSNLTTTNLPGEQTGNWDHSHAQSLTYKGVIVHAPTLDAKTKAAVDSKLQALKEDGKVVNHMEIVVGKAKPGLISYVKEQIQEGKYTKDQAKKKWDLTDNDLQ